MPKFTKESLPKGSEALLNFLRTRCEPEGHKLINGCAMSVYDTVKIKKKIQVMIKKYKHDARLKKHIPMWESNIQILDSLKGK